MYPSPSKKRTWRLLLIRAFRGCGTAQRGFGGCSKTVHGGHCLGGKVCWHDGCIQVPKRPGFPPLPTFLQLNAALIISFVLKKNKIKIAPPPLPSLLCAELFTRGKK